MKNIISSSLIRFDDGLIDGVFQPIVDRTFRHPVDLALSCSIGSAVLFATGIVGEAMIAGPLIGAVDIAAAVSLIIPLWLRHRNSKIGRNLIKSGMANPLRTLLRRNRLRAVLFTVIVLTAFIRLAPGPLTMVELMVSIGVLLADCSLYFFACDLPPVKPRVNHQESPNSLSRSANPV